MAWGKNRAVHQLTSRPHLTREMRAAEAEWNSRFLTQKLGWWPSLTTGMDDWGLF